MGKILIICGIIIIITPKLFKSSYYQNENKYNLFLKVTGVFAILLNRLYHFDKIETILINEVSKLNYDKKKLNDDGRAGLGYLVTQ